MALLDTAGLARAHVVGHDWGAAVGWALAMEQSARLSSYTSVSIPHTAAFLRAMWTSTQGLASWYMGVFQVPGLAERMLDPARGPVQRERFVTALLRSGQTRERAERDASFMCSPGAFSAAVGWYRAAALGGTRRCVAARHRPHHAGVERR